jgi:hypothetical protein
VHKQARARNNKQSNHHLLDARRGAPRRSSSCQTSKDDVAAVLSPSIKPVRVAESARGDERGRTRDNGHARLVPSPGT